MSALDRFVQPADGVVFGVWRRQRRRLRVAEAPGHAFHGNQWTGKTFSSKESANEWGGKTQTWAADITSHQEHALQMYTTVVGINDKLRGNKPLGTEDAFHAGASDATDAEREFMSEASTVKALDEIFSKPGVVLQENVTAHRAWIGSGIGNKDVGATFIDKGFTSTALDRKETEVFSSVDRPGRGGERLATLVEIRVPRGTRALYLGTKPENRYWYAESTELLLDRNTKYRVVASDRLSGPPRASKYARARHVVLEVVM